LLFFQKQAKAKKLVEKQKRDPDRKDQDSLQVRHRRTRTDEIEHGCCESSQFRGCGVARATATQSLGQCMYSVSDTYKYAYVYVRLLCVISLQQGFPT